MKVLHVIPSIEAESGGPVRALIGFINAVKEEIEPSVATTKLNLADGELTNFRDSIGSEIPVKVFSHFGSHSRNISIGLFGWLIRNINNYDVLHIHAMFHPISSYAANLARKRHIPYILRPLGTLSTYTLQSRNTKLKQWYYRLVDKRLVNHACCLHFTSQLEMEDAKKIHTENKGMVIPIPIPQEIGEIYPAKTSDTPEARKVLFLSRLHPKKGLELLIRAFAMLPDHYDDVELIIAGTGADEYTRELDKQVKLTERQNRIHFAGFIEGEKKQKLLAESTIFVLPSHDENFGVAVSEAMGAGLPVIVSHYVGLADEIEQHRAGLAVEIDADHLQSAMQLLLDNKELRDSMGVNGRRLVESRYSYSRVGADLLALYTGCSASKH